MVIEGNQEGCEVSGEQLSFEPVQLYGVSDITASREKIVDIMVKYHPRVCEGEMCGAFAIFQRSRVEGREELRQAFSPTSYGYMLLKLYQCCAENRFPFDKAVDFVESRVRDINRNIASSRMAEETRDDYKEQAKQWRELFEKEVRNWESQLANDRSMESLRKNLQSRKMKKVVKHLSLENGDENAENLPQAANDTRRVTRTSSVRGSLGERRDRRTHSKAWSEIEVKSLIDEYVSVGPRWAKLRNILVDEKQVLDPSRTNVDIKDKWRNIYNAVKKEKIMRGITLDDSTKAYIRDFGDPKMQKERNQR